MISRRGFFGGVAGLAAALKLAHDAEAKATPKPESPKKLEEKCASQLNDLDREWFERCKMRHRKKWNPPC